MEYIEINHLVNSKKKNPHSYPQPLWVSHLSMASEIFCAFFSVQVSSDHASSPEPPTSIASPTRDASNDPLTSRYCSLWPHSGFTPVSFGFTWFDAWAGS